MFFVRSNACRKRLIIGLNFNLDRASPRRNVPRFGARKTRFSLSRLLISCALRKRLLGKIGPPDSATLAARFAAQESEHRMFAFPREWFPHHDVFVTKNHESRGTHIVAVAMTNLLASRRYRRRSPRVESPVVVCGLVFVNLRCRCAPHLRRYAHQIDRIGRQTSARCAVSIAHHGAQHRLLTAYEARCAQPHVRANIRGCCTPKVVLCLERNIV